MLTNPHLARLSKSLVDSLDGSDLDEFTEILAESLETPDGFPAPPPSEYSSVQEDLPTELSSKRYPEMTVLIARRIAGRLAVDLSDNQRKVLARIIARGFRDDLPEPVIGGMVQDRIGLTPRQEQAVENFHRGLIERGEPRGVARRKTREYAKRQKQARADRIVVTEMTRARTIAQQVEWERDQKIAPGAYRKWVAVLDDKTCPVCSGLHGTVASLSRAYGNGMPGPPAHPNCRCHEELVTKDWWV